MKKFVVLLTLVAAGGSLNAAIMYNAVVHCDGGGCLTGSVTTSVSWELEAQVVSVEVDDNLGNFLFGLNGPLVPTNIGSIEPSPQTVSGLDLATINLLTSQVGINSVNRLGTTAAAPTFANVTLITSGGSIGDSTRFTAFIAFGSVATPEPVTWSLIAAGLGVMFVARARRAARR
ncbi:MAG: hypothetical protein M3O35_06885 [Acidobacteriota bacterium]|nr:hypothetical protein [Acidobacteriota bacterium]